MSDSDDSKSNLENYDDSYAVSHTSSSGLGYNWTEEKCLELIREYRQQPTLWDPNNKYYYKKIVKTQIWEEIGRKVGVPAETCKSKMVILLSSFRREKSKIVHSITKGNENEIYTSVWFAFKDLSFLMDKECANKRRHVIHEEFGDETMRESDMTQEDDDEPVSKRRRYDKAESATSPATADIEIIDTYSEPATSPRIAYHATKHGGDVDEIKIFLSFIESKMRKYSENTKNCVQQAMCEVIFKADQRCYETNKCCCHKQNRTVGSSEVDPLSKDDKSEDCDCKRS